MNSVSQCSDSVLRGNPVAAPRAPSQLEQHNNALRAELEGLNNDIDTLSERLARVTRADNVAPGNEKLPPEELLVTAAQEARGMGKMVCSFRSRVRNLTDRVEA